MSTGAKIVVGLIAVAVVLKLVGLPFWVVALIVVGVPVAGYLMLDPMQRRRLRQAGRRQIGS